MKYLLVISTFLVSAGSVAQSPLAITKRVADYIVANTAFQYQLDVYKPSTRLSDLQSVDFGRTFGTVPNTVAFACTQIETTKDTIVHLELSYTGTVQLSLNNEVVYKPSFAEPSLKCQFLERSLALPYTAALQLHKGVNTLMVKALSTTASEWKLLLQCPDTSLQVGLQHFQQLGKQAQSIANFLVTGGFTVSGANQAFGTTYDPEKHIDLATLFRYGVSGFTWTIPKVELTQSVINPQLYWGSFYNYNYHTAGVAWAMAELGNTTGEQQYAAFTNKYCQFILHEKPFVSYQVRSLWQTQSTDNLMVNTPLLDFTSAPAMPFGYRLSTEQSFTGREAYNEFFQGIKHYIFHQQIRTALGNFTRETPEKYTTWVDDMFMGLPFIMCCAKETKDAAERKQLQDDAARQVLGFAELLFDKKDSLFHHARHSNRPNVNYPYWLRANGWGLWAITEVLKGLPPNHPAYNKIMELYKAHIQALISKQDASGMWPNIVNIPTARLETSGSAIITLAIARGINEGWLNRKTYEPYAVKAWNGISKRIEPDGQVNDIIIGSFTSEDYRYYENQPMVKNDSHGMLCVLMCGLEMNKLLPEAK